MGEVAMRMKGLSQLDEKLLDASLLKPDDSGLTLEGPVGGPGGAFFDDLGNYNPRTIKIHKVEARHGDTLNSLTVTYLVDGKLVPPIKHGNSDGGPDHSVFVMDPTDRLIFVGGKTHIFDGTDELNGVVLGAVRRDGTLNVGQVGKSEGSPFVFQPDETGGHQCEIACFGGRQGLFVDALGIYYRVLETSPKSPRK
jgi:hypothetical protein